MKKFSPILLLLSFFWFIPFHFFRAHAQGTFPQPASDMEESQIDQSAMEDNGPHFYGGESVWLSEDLMGDVYVGAGDARVDSMIDGDLLIGAGQVVVSGHVTKDVRIGAGQVTISGIVDGNVTVGAGTVTFTRESEVKGSVVVGAGQVVLDGIVDGQTYTWGGQIQGNGQFHRNFQGKAGALMLGPSAVVQGDVSFQTDEEPQVADKSVIHGRSDIRIVEPSEQERNLERAKKTFNWAEIVLRVLMATVGAAVLYHFFPNLFTKTSKHMLTNSWSSLAWGFILLIMTPILVIISLVTVIGIPLGGLLFLMYLMALVTSGWFVSFAAGKKMYEFSQIEFIKKPIAQIFLGTTALIVCTHIPVIGGVVAFVRLLLGLGAIWFIIKELIVHAKKE